MRNGYTVIELTLLLSTIAIFVLIITLTYGISTEIRECGGVAKCLGKQVKEFKEGMDE